MRDSNEIMYRKMLLKYKALRDYKVLLLLLLLLMNFCASPQGFYLVYSL